jgi:EpsI family protein
MPDRLLTRRAAVAALLMAAAAAGGRAMVPTRMMSRMRVGFDLDKLVPASFGGWRVDPSAVGGVVNPQAEALINQLYSKLLNRTYVNADGRRVMLSIAYGDDQADDSVQLHYPEVCYPAQGFQLKSSRKSLVQLPQGDIKVRRLETQRSDNRFEPVTYWTIIGDQQSLGGWDRKIAEIRHGLHGEIVDGLLFRISTLDVDSAAGFRLQDEFIRDVVAAMAPEARRQLVGLG